ncbi:MAG: acyl-CoA dehydrogenase family protein [Euryarchaeota archaeon]|nr:acyl-CoA dehydrogenase family protein [Euryarchaeota archaeon]
MDFRLSPDQELVRDTVRRFCRDEMMPRAKAIDKTGEFPRDMVKRMGELGLLGMFVPPDYGGAGSDYVSFGLTAEEITRASATCSVIWGANTSLTCGPIYNFGTEEQKHRFLPKLCSGEYLGAYALTEPQAGSDAANLQTTARKEKDEFVLDGQKTFITNGSVADVIVVFATMDKKAGHRGISAFLVPRKSKGLTLGEDFEKMGLHGSPTSQLLFDECRIPAENMVGKPGEGFKIAMATLDTGRIMAAAGSVGIARGCLEESLAYAKERKTFGKPIGEHQAVQFMLADIATNIEAGRLLYLRAASLRDKGERYTKEASMAKVFASEMAMDAAIKGIQIHGGNGYITDYNVERYFRDIKIFEIFEGTSEIQRIVIAREVLGG